MQRPDFKKTDDMFNRVLQRDNIAVVTLLENKTTGTRFIIVNAHIHWDPQYRDVKLVQVALLVDEVDKIAARFAKYPPRLLQPEDGEPHTGPTYADGTKIPLIICGDFNSVPDSGVYEFLANGTVPSTHPDFMSHVYGNYTSEGLRHRFGLKSAYSSVGELPMTNYTPSFSGVIDYIWYSTNNLAVTSVLGEVDKGYLSKVVGFPNVHFPSECVLFTFMISISGLTFRCFLSVTSPSSASSGSDLQRKLRQIHLPRSLRAVVGLEGRQGYRSPLYPCRLCSPFLPCTFTIPVAILLFLSLLHLFNTITCTSLLCCVVLFSPFSFFFTYVFHPPFFSFFPVFLSISLFLLACAFTPPITLLLFSSISPFCLGVLRCFPRTSNPL